MRVIAGSARGKKLCSIEGRDIRPTLDRVKESVFNMIAFDLPGSSVLDLFCGTGALGIEALSRGAQSAVLVDESREALAVSEQNLNMTRLSARASLVLSDSIAFLNGTDQTFDIIFIDPPYQSDLYEKALFAILNRQVLKPGGLVVAEFDKRITPPFDVGAFQIHREKQYGRVKILIMKE